MLIVYPVNPHYGILKAIAIGCMVIVYIHGERGHGDSTTIITLRS